MNETVNQPKKSNKLLKIIGCCVSVPIILIIAMVAYAAFGPKASENKDYQAKLAERKAKINRTYSKLFKSYEAFPKTQFAQLKCDDAKIKSNYKDGAKVNLPVVDYAYMAKFKPDDKAIFDYSEDWVWINNDRIVNDLKPLSKMTDNDLIPAVSALEDLEEARYFAVLYSAEKNNVPTLMEDKTYVPGIYKGWVSIYDTVENKVECMIDLEVKSSETIKYTTKGVTRQSPEAALKEDFEENFNTTINKRIDLISNSIDVK